MLFVFFFFVHFPWRFGGKKVLWLSLGVFCSCFFGFVLIPLGVLHV